VGLGFPPLRFGDAADKGGYVFAAVEACMQWWAWVLVVLVVIVALTVGLLAVQSRRRRGGVIVDPNPTARRDSRRDHGGA
jgi:hypothetical protein